MRLRRKLADLGNRFLRPLGAQVVSYAGNDKPWDQFFLRWISEGKLSGKDPNDLGDLDWNDDQLRDALEKRYLPVIHPNSVVLEVGPGTGRLTRHIISRCREMILVDNSLLVCRWLPKYFKGKGTFRAFLLDQPRLPMVENNSVDVILAHGVFEHIDMGDLFWFLEDFYRVLKSEGVVSFNFDNITSSEGMASFIKFLGRPGNKSIFRFYHPDVVRKLAEAAGFRVAQLVTNSSRFAHICLQKAP